MALQDLTPQLRTRLSRMERAVGWFVILAAALMLFGFGYYLYNMSQRKGWFTPQFKYQTSLNNAAGIKEGDPIRLMGFNAGEITKIIPNAPDAYFGVTIEFTVLKPHYGYIWDDSVVKVSSDLLGNRFLEITKGSAGVPTIEEDTNKVAQTMLRWEPIKNARPKVVEQVRTEFPDLERNDLLTFNWHVKDRLEALAQSDRRTYYTNLDSIYWIPPQESAAVGERLEKLVSAVEEALPNILQLTNSLATVLSNSVSLTANLSDVAANARPVVSNLTLLTENLNHPGALGEWLLPTNTSARLDSFLGGADTAAATANTNLLNLNETLIHLANLTSNLNHQVQMNTNILSNISAAVENADNLVQGLKRHWLLRSAFKPASDSTQSRTPAEPLHSPKAGAR